MSAVSVIVLYNLEDAQREISLALSRGDVLSALGTAQCLRALCGCEAELANSLQHVRDVAWANHSLLSREATTQLEAGLNEVEDVAKWEGLLAVA